MTSWGSKTLPRTYSAQQASAWADRIEKETRHFLHGLEDFSRSGSGTRSGDEKQKRHRRRHSHRRLEEGTGSGEDSRRRRHDSAPLRRSTGELALSDGHSRRHGHGRHEHSQHRHSSSRSQPSTPQSASGRSTSSVSTIRRHLPVDLHPMSHFDVLTDVPIMSLRPLAGHGGKVPKMKCRTVVEPAHWVPGTNTVTTYRPVFYYEEESKQRPQGGGQ